MKRTLMLAYTCDPYIALYSRKMAQNWIKEVDQVLIHVNGNQPFMCNFIKSLWPEVKVVVKYHPITQGEAFNELWPLVEGDIVITLDSDNVIYEKGVLDGLCEQIEGGLDLVGTGHPYLTVFRKSVADQFKVDFRDYFDGDLHIDVMQDFLAKFGKQTDKIKIIPQDTQRYEHISRLSSFFQNQFLNYELGDEVNPNFSKPMDKLFSRFPRVCYLYHIFNSTKDQFPYSEFNQLYGHIFDTLLRHYGFNMHQVNQYISENKLLNKELP